MKKQLNTTLTYALSIIGLLCCCFGGLGFLLSGPAFLIGGFQRALLLIWEGSFLDAFYMYAAIYPLIILFCYLIVTRFYKFKDYKKGINVLSILSITTIIISYTIKQLFI